MKTVRVDLNVISNSNRMVSTKRRETNIVKMHNTSVIGREALVCLPDGKSDFFDMVAGVLHGDTLETYVSTPFERSLSK